MTSTTDTKTAAIVLAAGKGTRFKSATAKVLHPLLGRPMVSYPLDLAVKLGIDPVVVVIGHQAEAVEKTCGGPGIRFALQAEQKGTGHAVACAEESLEDFEGDILILSGDVPLLSVETMSAFMAAHRRTGASLTFMSAVVKDPFGYGRVLRTGLGYQVVEHKDAGPEILSIREINAGIYLAKSDFLFEALWSVDADNAQHEYYLPDIIRLANHPSTGCTVYQACDNEEVLGVNDRWQLAQAQERLRMDKLKTLAREGVSFQDPATTYLDHDVRIGPDTRIGAGVHLLGQTVIGNGVVVEPNCLLTDARVADGGSVPFGSKLSGDID